MARVGSENGRAAVINWALYAAGVTAAAAAPVINGSWAGAFFVIAAGLFVALLARLIAVTWE